MTVSRPRHVTLRDVAVRAEVSLMTVSNAVNGKHTAMTAETLERIEAAIAELGYRPHGGGRGLRSRRHNAIGMIVIDHSPNFLADPFITNLVAGMSHALNARNYGLLVQGAGQQTLERLSMLRSVVTDGICVLASGPLEERIEAIRTVAASGQPIVVFQEGIAVAESSDVCILRQDDEGAGRVVANHLFDHGASRLLFLNSDRVWAALTERIRGVRGAVSDVGGRASLDVLACIEEDFAETRRRVLDYVRHKGIPDAIIAGNDQMGIAAIKELQSIGLAVPRDVMVAGFNAFGFHRYSDPVLTTVRSAAYELGLRGADALMLRLETGSFPNLELVLPVELRVGGSTIKETDAT